VSDDVDFDALLQKFLSASLRSGETWEERDERIAREREQEQQQEKAQAERAKIDALRGGGFPERALKCALAPNDTPALGHARAFVATDRTLLALGGGTGTGKTTAAVWVALRAGGASPGFLRAADLEGRGRYDRELRGWLRERTCLVVDDLGAEVLDASGVFKSLLDEVIDLYYGSFKRIVLTTNLSGREVVQRYGQRVASRISEAGRWGDCGGEDLRRVKP
jgi:DNA replication protein DnaC